METVRAILDGIVANPHDWQARISPLADAIREAGYDDVATAIAAMPPSVVAGDTSNISTARKILRAVRGVSQDSASWLESLICGTDPHDATTAAAGELRFTSRFESEREYEEIRREAAFDFERL